MKVPQPVLKWAFEQYKRPQLDPQWLEECCQYLLEEELKGTDNSDTKIAKAIHGQVLGSRLYDSMARGTGLQTDISLPTTTTTLEGPVMVEILSLTEIAESAFNLNQTRIARAEVAMDSTVYDAEDDDESKACGGQPKMPKFSRGMLKLQLCDGFTVLPAIEYRSLPQLSLEETPLGCKLFLRGVKICRGTAFLEPKCVEVLGGDCKELNEHREADFVRNLRSRMRLPQNGPVIDIMPPRPGEPVILETRNVQRSSTRGLVTSNTASKTGGSTIAKSKYFNADSQSKKNIEIDFSISPNGTGLRSGMIANPPAVIPPPLFIKSPSPWTASQDAGFKPVSVNGLGLQLVQKSTEKHLGRVIKSNRGDQSDFGDDDMFEQLDDEALEVLDAAEKVAFGGRGDAEISHEKTDIFPSRNNLSSKIQNLELITIEDEDEDEMQSIDKENRPVPTRDDGHNGNSHVSTPRHTSSFPSQGSLRSRRPVVLASSPSAIIDLSDSD